MEKAFRFVVSGMLIMLVCIAQGQGRKEMTREQYIKEYADLAMKEMARVGIPASITLAQGCLESGNGNSTLAEYFICSGFCYRNCLKSCNNSYCCRNILC